jgi:DNA-binding PadR family transcriptional regulator
MHPYEISTTLRSRGKEESIKLNYGSLYSVVESLQKHGLIEVRETLRSGRRPERTVYAITPAGNAEFEDWLSELLSSPVREFTSLEAGLSLMPGLAPDIAASRLEDRAVKLQVSLGELKSRLHVVSEQGLPELFSIEDQYRIAMMTAELDFVAELARRVRSGELEGVPLWRRLHELLEQGVSGEELSADPVRYLGEGGRLLQMPESG